jgi:2',3'-cyclic-nucleotide 2'-phosphodiesterase (5'-nucleotidase family)
MMALMNGFLVRNEKVMTKGIPESELGNFVSDLVFQAAKDFSRESGLDSADFCLLNNGGFRSSLPTGDILLRHVYELMPFDNEIVVIEISSAATDSLFRYIRGRKGAPVSGLKLVLNDAAWESAVIGVSAFNDSSTYHVVTSDYLASGGDGAGFFLNPLSVSSTGIKIRDAIIQHMKSIHSSGKSISAANDGRISFH